MPLGSRSRTVPAVASVLAAVAAVTAGAVYVATDEAAAREAWNPSLGTGTITKRPAVVQNAEGDDSIAIRSMMYLFLSYDHRMVDGGDAPRFLTYMKKRLEEGAFEGELGL